MENGRNTGKSLRWLMAVPMMLLLASVFAEVGNCHSAQLAIREELNDTIATLAKCEGDLVAKQDTIRRLERINYAMAQPLPMVADQRMPGALLALSVLSMMAIGYWRRESWVLLARSPQSSRALSPNLLTSIRLTPMQRQLVDMLAAAPNRCVAKSEICAALWDKKDNAEESLYTLVRRTKKSLAESGMEIVCNRGESYELRVNS